MSNKEDLGESNCRDSNIGAEQTDLKQEKNTRQDLRKIPYDRVNNYSQDIIEKRQKFAESFSNSTLEHVKNFSIDPAVTEGNIENFIGTSQIPLATAGPIKMDGEHAQGEFLVPMCTTEGTLVASYNRGIKVCNLSGGVKTTVVNDSMQRAPVFIFDSAIQGKDFCCWMNENIEEIKNIAESTSNTAKFIGVDKFCTGKRVYTRFNFTTGDAAGQNMVSMATFAVCNWIQKNYEKLNYFSLEGNMSSDKKSSYANTLLTRGKRVIAEITINRKIFIENFNITPEMLNSNFDLIAKGAFMSGANNNSAHSANSIAAIFLATGQDAANITESSAGIGCMEITPDGDLYYSLTLPSLIVATYGGGTGLPTQRECLELMRCNGTGKVNKFAEIIAGVSLAGDLSLGAAMASTSSNEFVNSHEKFGRNR